MPDIDLDALEAEWEKEFGEDEETETDESTEDEANEDDKAESETEDESTDEDEESEDEKSEDEESEDEKDESKGDEDKAGDVETVDAKQFQDTIAQLQKQLDESQKVATLFDQIATENGISRDELLKQFEQKQIEDEAKRQNVPVEFLQKQRDQENELKTLREEVQRDKFNSNVARVVQKFGLKQDEIKETLDYAYQSGLDPFKMDFEAVYKAANFDKLLEKQMKEARQKELSNKQKRMSKATVTHGGSATPSSSIDDDVTAFLKEQGII
jgi:hypothetical protein